MSSSAAVPYGPIAFGVGKIGAWLWAARQAHVETEAIIGPALRSSICRYDPYAPGVAELATRIEAAMWDVAKTAAGGRPSFPQRFLAHVPLIRHRMRRNTLDFPHWRRELKSWLEAAVREAGIVFENEELDCRNFPASGEALAERFPAMFRLELASPARMRTNGFRRDLLARVEAAGDLQSRFGAGLPWLTAGGAAIAMGAVGLGFAEIANLSDVGAVAAASGAVGGIVTRLLAQPPTLTETQQRGRHLCALWVTEYLSLYTQMEGDESPELMLQEAIERQSAMRNCSSADFDPMPPPAPEQIAARREELHSHLVNARAADDGKIASALENVDKELDKRDGSPGEPADTVLPAIHLLLVGVQLAPPTA